LKIWLLEGDTTLSSQDDKFDPNYWEDMVNSGDQFVSADSMVYYIVLIGIVVQSISLLITPSNWLIWNALTFIVATNLGAVVLAVKAQRSAEDISRKTSQAFNADFYHTIHLFTEFKKRFEKESQVDGNGLQQEIDLLGGDLYHVAKGYVMAYASHMNTEVDMAESKDIPYVSEEELFD
jgi:hypothetical protein